MQIYSLSLTSCLYFQIIESTNLETETPPNNPLYSSTWPKIWDWIQVFNEKEEEVNIKVLIGIHSVEHLATLYFRKCIRPFSASHTQALLKFFDTISIEFLQPPPSTSSEFEVEVWSYWWLNKRDAKRNIGFLYLCCQKNHKKMGKDLSHIRYCVNNPCFNSFSIEYQNFCFAQVLFFFSVSIKRTRHDVIYLLLVLINTISVIDHGDLFKIDCRKSRKTEVINIDCIAGLVRLVRKKDNTYIVY